MQRHSIDIRITQQSPSARYRVSVNYYIDGRVVKTLTKTVANTEHKQLDATLQVILAAGVQHDVKRWAQQGTLFD